MDPQDSKMQKSFQNCAIKDFHEWLEILEKPQLF